MPRASWKGFLRLSLVSCQDQSFCNAARAHAALQKLSCANINVDADRDRAFAEAKRFLDSYYSVDYRQDMLKLWVAAGSPAQCVQSLQRYVEAGATTILLRVAGYDQKRQFKRVTEEILPALS